MLTNCGAFPPRSIAAPSPPSKRAVHWVAIDCADFVGIEHLSGKLKTPLLPLILGVDDVTILTTSEYAFVFLPVFLRLYEELLGNETAVSENAERVYGVKRLGMTAGVANVKPHYPYSSAYALAEGLAHSAKRQLKDRFHLKNGRGTLPVTVLDFHVHHSSSGDDIGVIREELQLRDDKGEFRLWGGPYVVTEEIETQLCCEESTGQVRLRTGLGGAP